MFLSCGDSLFDLFVGADEAGVSSIALNGRIGGSAFNVALGLARLGQPSAFFTKLSDDAFGERIGAFMERENIDRRFLVSTTRNTTLAIVSLSPAGTPRYKFFIEGAADRSVEPGDLPAAFPDAVRAIHVGGSYSSVMEPTASTLRGLVAREGSRRFISYDPNIRASVQPDLDRWRAAVAAFAPAATVVKASEEDLDLLYPGRSAEAVLADWIAGGAALAVITRGEHGAMALGRSGAAVSVPGVAITVADTVGAGDTFQAALLTKLAEDGALSREGLAALDGRGIEDLLRFAVRAAAITCSRRGADLPRRAELDLPL